MIWVFGDFDVLITFPMCSHYVPNVFLQDVPMTPSFISQPLPQSWTLISDVVLQIFGIQIPFFTTCRIFLIIFGDGWTKVAHCQKNNNNKTKKIIITIFFKKIKKLCLGCTSQLINRINKIRHPTSTINYGWILLSYLETPKVSPPLPPPSHATPPLNLGGRGRGFVEANWKQLKGRRSSQKSKAQARGLRKRKR